MLGIIPQYTLESSIAHNFGVGFEHGPQTTTISTQIVPCLETKSNCLGAELKSMNPSLNRPIGSAQGVL